MALQFSGVSYTLFGEIIHIVSCRGKGEEEGGEGQRKGGEEEGKGGEGEGGSVAWACVARDAEFFQELVLSDTMFVDHFPWHSEAGLHSIAKRIIAKREREGKRGEEGGEGEKRGEEEGGEGEGGEGESVHP